MKGKDGHSPLVGFLSRTTLLVNHDQGQKCSSSDLRVGVDKQQAPNPCWGGAEWASLFIGTTQPCSSWATPVSGLHIWTVFHLLSRVALALAFCWGGWAESSGDSMYYLKYLLPKALNFVVFKKELRNSCDRFLISCLTSITYFYHPTSFRGKK